MATALQDGKLKLNCSTNRAAEPNLLLTGPAGRGKSMLLARIIHQRSG